ncbi:MAG TPA: MFS transporter [Gemmatimonadales bacterium]|nr:MFS transporter [Gemmatimonadales bacterium]
MSERSGAPTMSGRYLWYALALLAFGNLLNYLDRNIILALFEPIKDELDITDTQLGWLGSSYAIAFALGALGAGVLSDLRSRRTVIAGGVALWSGFTALGGAAATYWHLLTTRGVVGVAESSYLPAAQAMLADYFPDRGRAQAMGIFWAGLAVGGVLAVWLGGHLATAFGWRTALIVVGLPGILFALLLARLRDPRPQPRPMLPQTRAVRRIALTPRLILRAGLPLLLSIPVGAAVFGALILFRVAAAADTAVFGAIVGVGLVWTIVKWVRVAMRWRHRLLVGVPADAVDEMLDAAAVVLRTPTLVWMFIGGALTTAAMNSLVAWSASYLQRVLDMSLLQAGRQIGLVGLVAGVLGSWIGGRSGDRLMERTPAGRVIAGAVGFLAGAPLCVVLLLVNDVRLFSGLFFVVVFFFTWYNGPAAAVLFDVVPRGIAATVMGAYVFFIHIAGDAIALPVVGLLSDRYGLRVALMTLPAVGLLGGALLLLAVPTVARDMARVRSPAAA